MPPKTVTSLQLSGNWDSLEHNEQIYLYRRVKYQGGKLGPWTLQDDEPFTVLVASSEYVVLTNSTNSRLSVFQNDLHGIYRH